MLAKASSPMPLSGTYRVPWAPFASWGDHLGRVIAGSLDDRHGDREPDSAGNGLSYRQYSPLRVSAGGEFSGPSADRTTEALISLHAWMPDRDASAGSDPPAAPLFPAVAWDA
jgi:hypothetical protein